MQTTLILMLLAGAAVALWFDALAARELAGSCARRLCRDAGVQLLDQTVVLRRLGLARKDGRLCLRRSYAFEVSFDGTDRHAGSINMLGRKVGSYTVPMQRADLALTDGARDPLT